MRRRRQDLLDAAQRYFGELQARFPGISISEVVPGGYGFDLWIAVAADPDSAYDIHSAASELNSRWFDETGLTIIVTVRNIAETVPA